MTLRLMGAYSKANAEDFSKTTFRNSARVLRNELFHSEMDRGSRSLHTKAFQPLRKTLSSSAEQIINFFRFRLTSGRIESVDSIIARIQLKILGLLSVVYSRSKLWQLTATSFARFFDAARNFVQVRCLGLILARYGVE